MLLKMMEIDHIISIYRDQPEIPFARGNLYLGDAYTFEEELFNKYQITCILSVINNQEYNALEIGVKVEQYKIPYHLWINLQDRQESSIDAHLQSSSKYISQMLQNGNVYVHCRMGISRSASLVIAFVMEQLKLGYYDAKKYVSSRRDIICPNPNFQKSLIEYEKKLKTRFQLKQNSQYDQSESDNTSEKQVIQPFADESQEW